MTRPRYAEYDGTIPTSYGAPVVLGLMAYITLAFPLRHWLIDDAAISMAYAANWSAGHGLVAQPGQQPVEGYSNFSWVVVLAAMHLLGLMDLTTIKAISVLLVALALMSLNATAHRLMPNRARFAVLLLVGTSASIVPWTTSGLENPLTLLISCELMRIAIYPPSKGGAVYAAMLIAALAMTRPEGIAFGLFPAVFMWRRPRMLALYVTIASVLFATFLAFRMSTFGDLVPNTYYAKEAASLQMRAVAANAGELLSTPFGLAPVTIAVLGWAYLHRTPLMIIPLCMAAIAGGLFILMPTDWMPFQRFATPFFPAFYLLAGVALRKHTAVLGALVVLAVGFNAYRLQSFYSRPPISVATVEARDQRFLAIAKKHGIEEPSLLTPDVGGHLLRSSMRIYDLAGLTDRRVARTLYADRRSFADYVFNECKPTFITWFGLWAPLVRLDQDPRFSRDYIPIREQVDPWVLKYRGMRIATGEYIRRDAIRSSRQLKAPIPKPLTFPPR